MLVAGQGGVWRRAPRFIEDIVRSSRVEWDIKWTGSVRQDEGRRIQCRIVVGYKAWRRDEDVHAGGEQLPEEGHLYV